MIKDMPYILRGLERVSNGKGIEIVLQYDRSGNCLHEYRANQHHSVLRKWLETVVFYRNTFFFPISYQNDWFVEFQLTDRAYLSVADERRASVRSVAGQGIALSWQVSNLIRIVRDVHEAGRNRQRSSSDVGRGAVLFVRSRGASN